MKLLTPNKDGRLVLDMDDVVQRGMTVVLNGEKMWPPPPVQVSAAPTAKPAAAAAPAKPEKKPLTMTRRFTITAIGAVALFLLTAFSPTQLIGNFTVFVLAIVIGYYVIGNVHHALHTPLMSITNAISAVIIVGALLQIGHHDTVITTLSFVAILLVSINMFGGFAVTRRMLGMFSNDSRDRRAGGIHRCGAVVHPQPGRVVQARDGPPRHLLRHRGYGDRTGGHHRTGRAWRG
jgi:H+-translocating NAD(P) transhydrogenase subunit alpha